MMDSPVGGKAYDVENREQRGAIAIVPDKPEIETPNQLGEEIGLRDFGCYEEDDSDELQ